VLWSLKLVRVLNKKRDLHVSSDVPCCPTTLPLGLSDVSAVQSEHELKRALRQLPNHSWPGFVFSCWPTAAQQRELSKGVQGRLGPQ